MNATINNISLEELGLVWLQGSLDNLLKPAELKPLVLNESASIDGTRAITTGRRVKARDVSVKFRIKASSPLNLVNRIDSIVAHLINGKDNTGVNELRLIDYDRIYRLVYLKCDKYTSFGANSAIVSFTFKELNPNNRR